ncbi:MAG: hypothetical protein FWD76_03535 [Firmicutes bacterium]|nr:hypothetical protein [Bacillota bacterium]
MKKANKYKVLNQWSYYDDAWDFITENQMQTLKNINSVCFLTLFLPVLAGIFFLLAGDLLWRIALMILAAGVVVAVLRFVWITKFSFVRLASVWRLCIENFLIVVMVVLSIVYRAKNSVEEGGVEQSGTFWGLALFVALYLVEMSVIAKTNQRAGRTLAKIKKRQSRKIMDEIQEEFGGPAGDAQGRGAMQDEGVDMFKQACDSGESPFDPQ